jgi:membrane fusion protein, multidrug efflux system
VSEPDAHARPESRKRRSAKVLLPLLVLAVGAAVAVALVLMRPRVERAPEAPRAPLVRVLDARADDLRVDVESQGTVAPSTRTTLTTQVGGSIEWVSARFAEGAFFDALQPLVRIDAQDYRLAIQQAQAALAQSQVRLAQEQAEAAVAREEWRDLGRGTPGPLVLRQPQLAEARAAVEAARANLEQARLNLARTEIKAPYAGRVQARRADRGQFVTAGTALADIYATDYAEVRLPVQEKDLAFLDVDLGAGREAGRGPPVELHGEVAGRSHTWDGHIVRVAAAIDPKTRLLDLFARIENPFNRGRKTHPAPLPMGLFVEAEIRGKTLEGVYVLPRAALREGAHVLVVDAENRLRFRSIEVARTEAEDVVISGGLQNGDTVVVSPLETPVEGMLVQTTPADAPPGMSPLPAAIR